MCPARCLHCGGLHLADYPQCLLRPTPRGPKTKAEKAAILETSKLARLQACTTAKCSRNLQTDLRAPNTPRNSPRNPQPNLGTQPLLRNYYSPLQIEVLPTTSKTPT